MELQTVVDAGLAKIGRGGPAAQKIQAEADAANVAERQKLRVEADRLRGELQAGTPLTRAMEAAAEKLKTAQAAARAAEAVYIGARVAETTWRTSREGQIGALEGALRASASSRIDALRLDLLEMHSAARNNQPLPMLIRRRNPILDRKVVVGAITSGPSSRAHMSAIVEAIRQLDVIALEALTEEALGRRLDALLAEIPEIVEETVLAAPAVA
jgi:hypothetical protein